MRHLYRCDECDHEEEHDFPISEPPPGQVHARPHLRVHADGGLCAGAFVRRVWETPRLTFRFDPSKHADAYAYYTGYSEAEGGRDIAARKFGSQVNR